MKTIPDTIRSILNKTCSVIGLDVVYDNDDDIAFQDRRAAKLGLTIERDEDNTSEIVTGKVESVFKYLKDYNEADYGYQCSSVLEIPLDSEDDIIAFNDFVKWMTASYEDFADGISDNNVMSKYLRN